MPALRRTMRREFPHHIRRLAPTSYLEQYEVSAFDGGTLGTLFHENSKLIDGQMERARRSVETFDSAAMAYAQTMIGPDYPDRELIELPVPETPLAPTIDRVLAARRSASAFADRPVSIDTLGSLLGMACGVTGSVEITHEAFDGPRSKPLRAYPSAGGLYPIEAYLLVRQCDGLSTGRYYYVPERHGLRVLDRCESLAAALDRACLGSGAGAPSRASVLVVLTGAFWRSLAKYGPRGYRFVLQESGHLAQNLLLVAAALGLAALPVGGFFDDRLDELLGVDGVNEATVYAVAIGTPQTSGQTGGSHAG